MKIKILALLCLSFVLLATTCDENPPAGYVKIRNTDDEPFSFAYSFRETPPTQNYLTVESLITVAPSEEMELPYTDYDLSGQRRFYIYIYKQSTLDQYTREEAEQQGLYDARLDFNEAELEALNFTVGYDGN